MSGELLKSANRPSFFRSKHDRENRIKFGKNFRSFTSAYDRQTASGSKSLSCLSSLDVLLSHWENGAFTPFVTSLETNNVIIEREYIRTREAWTKMKTRVTRWSGAVTRRSNALDLEPDVFKQSDPRRIARSLKRSSEASHRRKSTPYQSAMSMLNFYINRGGSNVSAKQKRVLARAKTELRKAFHKT